MRKSSALYTFLVLFVYCESHIVLKVESHDTRINKLSNRALPPCDFICDDVITDKRVCGTDGVVYKSKCEYNNAVCRARSAGQELHIANFGPCINMSSPCDEVVVVKCAYDKNVPAADLLCGSDKHTYRSMCSFIVRKCYLSISGYTLTINHTGSCETENGTDTIDCQPYIIDTSGLALEVASDDVIVQACPSDRDYLCSISGRTFLNECAFCSDAALRKNISQNKNKYVIGYSNWRVVTRRHQTIEYMMQVPGHARCLVDSGFASLKKLYRRTDCDSLQQLEQIFNISSTTNEAVRYPTWQWRDWKSFLEPVVKPVSGIRKYQYFRMTSEAPGVVFVKTDRDSDEISTRTIRGGVNFTRD